MSGFSILNNSAFYCEDHCVAWGNRDDSLRTLPNGHVGWVFASPLSHSIWVYDGKKKVRVYVWFALYVRFALKFQPHLLRFHVLFLSKPQKRDMETQ